MKVTYQNNQLFPDGLKILDDPEELNELSNNGLHK